MDAQEINSMNATMTMCEDAKEKFLDFLNGFVAPDHEYGQPSQASAEPADPATQGVSDQHLSSCTSLSPNYANCHA